jgi:hypothetical protein
MIPPLTNQQLIQQNQLLQDQLDLLRQEENAFESISGMISGNLADLTNTNEVRRVALNNARSLRSISDKLLSNDKEGGALSEKELKRLVEKAKENKNLLISKQNQVTLTDEEKRAYDDIILQSESLVILAEERLKKEQEISKAGGVLANSLKGIEGLLKKSGFGDLASKLNLNGAVRDATDFDDATGKATINASKGFKNIATNIKAAISPTDLLVAGLVKLFEAAKKADENIANIRRNFGLSFNEARKLNDQFASTALTSGDVTANVESLTAANQAVNDQLGIQTIYQDDLLLKTNQLISRNKLSAEAAAGFAQQVLATGISAEELESISAQTVANIQNQTGVQLSFNNVLEIANKTTGQLRANLMRTPDGLVKAVANAKALGVEMKDIAGIAGSLLDFEDSITKELEAELLIGRDLNLEQARYLALQGKSDEAVAALVKQAGSLEELQSMNVLQQDALAKAVGMTTDQLATTLEKQAAINSQKKEGLDIDAEAMKEGASALSIQEQLSSAVTKLNSILQATSVIIAALVGAAIGFFAGGIPGALIGLLAGGGLAMGTMGVLGSSQSVQDGIASPDRGPFTITDSYGATAITARGDGIAVSPNINQGSDNAEAKRTNQYLQELIKLSARPSVFQIGTDEFYTRTAKYSYQVQ